MHSLIALRRVQSQIGHPSTPDPVQVAYAAIQASTDDPPVTLDELRDVLRTELGVTQPVAEVCPPADNIHFDNIYEFASWYTHHQSEFSEAQRIALDTLLITRQGIEQGCACRRANREHLAHSYFGQFWANNCKTDLLATVAKITGAKRVSVSNVCVYPASV